MEDHPTCSNVQLYCILWLSNSKMHTISRVTVKAGRAHKSGTTRWDQTVAVSYYNTTLIAGIGEMMIINISM